MFRCATYLPPWPSTRRIAELFGDAFDRKIGERVFVALLETYARRTLSRRMRQRLSVAFRFGKRGYVPQASSSVFWDTRLGIELRHEGEIIAVIGFDVLFFGDLIIRQIQGVSWCDDILSHLRWERLLVALVRDIAARERIFRGKRLCVSDPREHPNYTTPAIPGIERDPELLREHQARMKRRYNGTARRLKFKWASWRWVLRLDDVVVQPLFCAPRGGKG